MSEYATVKAKRGRYGLYVEDWKVQAIPVRKLECPIGLHKEWNLVIRHFKDSIFYLYDGLVSIFRPNGKTEFINTGKRFLAIAATENLIHSSDGETYDLIELKWRKNEGLVEEADFMRVCGDNRFFRTNDPNGLLSSYYCMWNPETGNIVSWSDQKWNIKEFRKDISSKQVNQGSFKTLHDLVWSFGRLYLFSDRYDYYSLIAREIKTFAVGENMEPILVGQVDFPYDVEEVQGDENHLFGWRYASSRIHLLRIDKRSLESGSEVVMKEGKTKYGGTVRSMVLYRDMILLLIGDGIHSFYKDTLDEAHLMKFTNMKIIEVWNDTVITCDGMHIFQWTEPENWNPKNHAMYSQETRRGVRELWLIHKLSKESNLRILPRDILNLVCQEFSLINWNLVLENKVDQL